MFIICDLVLTQAWMFVNISEGYYMYTAASVRYANQTARIESPQITPRGKSQCLTFWYHMYGPNIGVMNLYVKKRPTLDSPLWTRAGDQGNQWQQGVVTLPSTGSYTVSLQFTENTLFISLFSCYGYGIRICEVEISHS